jgi:hypothetical protein
VTVHLQRELFSLSGQMGGFKNKDCVGNFTEGRKGQELSESLLAEAVMKSFF